MISVAAFNRLRETALFNGINLFHQLFIDIKDALELFPAQLSDETVTLPIIGLGGCLNQLDKIFALCHRGQDRFGFMWRDLTEGALGALVIVDTRRINDCYPAVDYFEKIGLPFVVAVNMFDGQLGHELTDVRWALAIGESTPVIAFDARSRRSVRDALVAVLNRALSQVT